MPEALTLEGKGDRPRQAAAWGVHVFTALGAFAGLRSVLAISDHQWIAAFVWMCVATGIDALDGTLARRFRVRETLPQFDGALLDNMVDYFTFVLVPAFFLYESGLVPLGTGWLAALAMVLCSGYQFCQVDAKTEDHCFKGFPSYWNVVVLYLFFLFPDRPWVSLALVLGFAAAVFVPIKYVYPTRTRTLMPLTIGGSLLWAAALALALWRYPEESPGLLAGSLVFVAYYFILSLWLTWKSTRAAGGPGA